MTIQHKLITPLPGDANSGNHILNNYEFLTEADMYFGSDVNFGIINYQASDVGRVAKVTGGSEISFFILVEHSTPIWRKINKDLYQIFAQKTVSTNTYSFLQEDAGRTIRFTHPSGVVLTVPHGLLSGTEGTVYAISGAVQFVTGGVGAAVPSLPLGISASTAEAMSVATFQISEITSSYILAGDLNYVGPDPLTDSDFTSNGRMVRNGAGNYNVILDTLSGTTNPFSGSDYNAGYRVGSFFVNQAARSAFMCVDDTPASASWRNLNRVSDAEYDMFMGPTSSGTVLFREEFATDLDLWTATVAGAGASTVLIVLNTRRPTGYCRLNPGTTFTGTSRVGSVYNFWYSSMGGLLDYTTIAGLPTQPADPVNNYEVFVNMLGDTTNGMAFGYQSGAYGTNTWKIIRWNTSVSSTISTTALALTGLDNSVDRKFNMLYDLDHLTASFYIDGRFEGRFTGTQIPTIAGAFFYPGWANKITGTTSMNTAYIDFSEAKYYFSASTPWRRK